jgi:hypothetical protein
MASHDRKGVVEQVGQSDLSERSAVITKETEIRSIGGAVLGAVIGGIVGGAKEPQSARSLGPGQGRARFMFRETKT